MQNFLQKILVEKNILTNLILQEKSVRNSFKKLFANLKQARKLFTKFKFIKKVHDIMTTSFIT